MRAEIPTRRLCERGSALLIVLVLSMVGAFSVLGISRLMLLNESEVGVAADKARAFAAATALLRDAEADVAGAWPDGRRCGPPDADAGCRSQKSGVFFPAAAGEWAPVADRLPAEDALPCRQGICRPFEAGTAADALLATPTEADAPRSFATYGEFTRPTAPSVAGQQDPYLVGDRLAGYWVEVLDYAVGAGIAGAGSRYQPDTSRPYVFRITAVVRGMRPDVQVVLREIFVPTPLDSMP